MATGDTVRCLNTSTKLQTGMCYMCFDIHSAPKQLPCSHTFCEECLKTLTENQLTGTIGCPCCGQVASAESVTDFKTYPDVEHENLESEGETSVCSSHPEKSVDLFCKECELTLCTLCKSPTHTDHDTEELAIAVTRAKEQLMVDRLRVESKLNRLSRYMEEAKHEQKELKDKRDSVEEDIYKRHEWIVSEANKYRDEALASLHGLTNETFEKIESKIIVYDNNLRSLRNLHCLLEETVVHGTASEILNEAKEMRSGQGSELIKNKCILQQTRTIIKPILHFLDIPETFIKQMRVLIGSLANVAMENKEFADTVTERFQCCDDNEAGIYGICPLDNGNIWVTYESNHISDDISPMQFDEHGVVVDTDDRYIGTISLQADNGNRMVWPPSMAYTRTFIKSGRFIFLETNIMECDQGSIKEIKIKSTNPVKTEIKKLFTINCTRQRAVDMNDDLTLVAVVEEGQRLENQRKVCFYGRSSSDAIALYNPSVSPWQPADVCFYSQDSSVVLLIADELKDAIHVVSIKGDNSVEFVRFLAHGSPLLIQPMALNRDKNNCIWVGCRGGRVLVCKPVVDHFQMNIFQKMEAFLRTFATKVLQPNTD